MRTQTATKQISGTLLGLANLSTDIVGSSFWQTANYAHLMRVTLKRSDMQ